LFTVLKGKFRLFLLYFSTFLLVKLYNCCFNFEIQSIELEFIFRLSFAFCKICCKGLVASRQINYLLNRELFLVTSRCVLEVRNRNCRSIRAQSWSNTKRIYSSFQDVVVLCSLRPIFRRNLKIRNCIAPRTYNLHKEVWFFFWFSV
jgi:hypothetical protein